MPAGDPAGYLPNVKKLRKRRGYVPRAKQPAPPKGVDRAKGLRIDKARMFSGMGPRKGVVRPGQKAIGFGQSMQNAQRALGLQKIMAARGQSLKKDSITAARQRDIQRAYKSRMR